MGFWIFMFIMALLIPITMIVLGRYFINNPPKNINYAFGYRTVMSMKNNDTWLFAHRYFGKLWYLSGIIMLPISLVVMIFVFGKTENIIGIVLSVLSFIQLIPLVGAIIPTEIALKRYFDEEGNRR